MNGSNELAIMLASVGCPSDGDPTVFQVPFIEQDHLDVLMRKSENLMFGKPFKQHFALGHGEPSAKNLTF